MSFLHEPGDLSRTPLAAILLEALNLRATGILTVRHGGGTSRLFIQQGKPVGAQVAVGLKPLGQILLQEGVIDIDVLSKSLVTMAETRRPQGDILVEMGAATREVVDRVLSDQQAGYFGLIAALEGGAWSFDAATPIPPWAARSPLSSLRTIVDALERPQASALVVSALQPAAASAVRLASSYASMAVGFRWSAEEEALLWRLSTPATLEEFFEPSDVPRERARAILAALLLLGQAVPAGARAGETPAGLEVDLGAAHPASSPPASPALRSDPAEARARRQRLLQQAMKNMGIGPFAGRPGQPAAPAGTGTAGAGGAARAGTTGPSPRADVPAARPEAGVRPARRSQPESPEAALRSALLAAAPRASEPDFYARLGLTPGAGRDEVKKAFLSLAKQFHPDRFASPALADLAEAVKDFFTAVNEAYETLSDDRRRSAYLARRSDAPVARAEAAEVDFTKGEACLRTRDFLRARGFFEAALRADPRAEYKAALALAWLSDPAAGAERERARRLAEEALSDPACDRAAYVAGLLARDDKDDARAEKHFRAAVAANPRNADAARELRLLERRRPR